jgi:tRNA U34 2-thiouridine synthase MnmA/TrmU
MKNINFLSSWQWWKAKCKIRYRQEDQNCEVTKMWEDEYEVKFEKKQRAIAVWQICAIYLWDELVMSGIIN